MEPEPTLDFGIRHLTTSPDGYDILKAEETQDERDDTNQNQAQNRR